ncbi:ABC transporter ATP-binding protein [Staphylococcus equorum]|uniref:ABC transporter ATP-binding protein n=1 Tax=Staphylococcus equorum TaxID=246432 RepID=UPI003F7904DC
MKTNPLLQLIKHIKWPLPLIIIALLISFIGSITGLIVPLFTGKLVDGFNNNNLTINYLYISIFAFIFLFNIALNGIGIYLLSKIGENIIYSLRYNLWNKVIHLKQSFFDDNESGELMSRLMDDTKVINSFISQKFPTLFSSIITIIGSIIMLFLLDWQLTLVIGIVIPILFMTIMPLGNYVQKIAIKTQNKTAELHGNLGRVLSDITLVKISTSETEELNNVNKNLRSILSFGLKQAKVFSIIQPLSGSVILIIIGIILGFGGIRVSSNDITAGILVSMIFYVIQLMSPLTNVYTIITDYKVAVGSSYRIYELLHEEEEIDHKNLNTPIINGDIIFKNIYFKYNSNYILENVNFKVPKNSKIAIVGPSGSGKTTIFKLIEQLYEADSGNIFINETPINNFSLQDWRANISYVTQDNFMMNGTIISNLLYGNKDDVLNKDVEHYLSLANCMDFIDKLDDGINSFVGEKGLKLSGGERQRLDIARSFIKNANILLLDEATSNLDSESEEKIKSSLNNLIKEQTTIIIAHRLSTIKQVDKIIFLDEGKITGMGDHAELYSNHNKYKNFVDSQMKGDSNNYF